MIPDDRKYTKEHEWVKAEGDTALVGITDYAQSSLGDITYVEPPEPGKKLKQGEQFSSVESVKAVNEIFSPVSGEVVESNEALRKSPETLNQDPYQKGWIVKLKNINPQELAGLMSAEKYKKFLESS